MLVEKFTFGGVQDKENIFFLYLKQKHVTDVKLKTNKNEAEVIIFSFTTSKLTGSKTLTKIMRELKCKLTLFCCGL
jgi:hypothetical protein